MTTAVQRTMVWLQTVLREGSVSVRRVEREAQNVGIGLRTLRRARSQLGVRSRPNGFSGPRYLSLPGNAASVDHAPVSVDHQKVETGPPVVATMAQTVTSPPRRRLRRVQ